MTRKCATCRHDFRRCFQKDATHSVQTDAGEVLVCAEHAAEIQAGLPVPVNVGRRVVWLNPVAPDREPSAVPF